MPEKPTYEELEQRIKQLEKEKSEFKRLGDDLEKRMVALTQPLNEDGGIAFEDLFNIDDMQRIQDEFAMATGVASIITRIDGTPITAPSNFCRLCKEIIRKTDKGLSNCFKSDAMIGRYHPGGPIIQQCMSGGLWDAGAGITVGGQHIANWLIGQVRDEMQTEAKMLEYAREIGANEEAVVKAFREVPAMSREQFEQIAKLLFTLANQLSTTAYQNVQQARIISELKNAERAIKESEERFRYLSDASMEAIFFSKNGFCLEANQVAAEIFGYDDRSQFIGLFGTELIAPESHDIVKSNMLNDKFEPYEAIGMRKNGTRFPISIRAKAMPYKDEGIVRVTSISDITKIKQAEAALRISEKKYQSLFENAQVALFRNRLSDGKPIEINERYAQMAGYSTVEECMAEFNAADAWVDPNGRNELLKILQKNGSVSDYEAEIVRRDGNHIWISFSASIFPEQGFLEGSIVDITEHKKVEEALRMSNDRLNLVLDTVPQFVFWKDLEGRYLGCNRVFAAAAGLDNPAQIVGKTDFDLPWPREDAEAYRADDIAVLASNRPKRHIIERVQKADGTRLWVDTSKAPLCDSNGRPFAVLGVFEDITERRRAEKEKADLESQLRQAQKMEAVGRLAGGVAHDFNNMLSVIIGHSEIALAQMNSGQPLYAELEQIRNAGERSADLTRQLLAFARKQTMAPKVLDLNKTVSGMISMLQRLIGEDIDLDWKPCKKVWLIKVDPSQIDQILANLCVNARDAIADIGKVTIETANTVFDKGFCTDHAGFIPGEYVLLAVSDNGCGMDNETMANVFEPFFTTKDPSKGTGLGLATVYGTVKQNNGFINVYSEPGQGTTFKIYLPRYLSKAAHLPEKEIGQLPECGNETILLVEDEPSILSMTTLMLERLGYTVVAAKTPGEAIQLAHEYPGVIHMLLTDVVMPEMNGRDLAKNILSSYPNLKRLFMSGYTANVIAHHGVLDEGVNFIQKPFSMENLSVKVREVLDEDKE